MQSEGVEKYIQLTTVITVTFPILKNGNADIRCRHCPYLSSNSRMCQLNKEPVFFPDDTVGYKCPLKEVK